MIAGLGCGERDFDGFGLRFGGGSFGYGLCGALGLSGWGYRLRFRWVCLRNEATLALEIGEGLEGFVEAAFGGGHGALNNRQDGEAGFEVVGRHGAGFELAHAAQTPVVFGQFVYQNVFGGGGGLVFAAEVRAEGVEFGGIFAGQDELLGVETVLEGVLAGGGFALGGAGTGGVL